MHTWAISILFPGTDIGRGLSEGMRLGGHEMLGELLLLMYSLA